MGRIFRRFTSAVLALGAMAATASGVRAQGPDLAPDAALYAASGPTSGGSGGSAEISVLSYNVHGLPWPLVRGRAAALREIGEELGRMRAQHRQPDIVLIQEGFLGSVADLIRLSGYRYWAVGPQRSDRPAAEATPGIYVGGTHIRYVQKGEGWGKWASAGLYVLSDDPIVDVATQAYRSCAGWDCLANKGVMMARIAVPGAPTPIDVVNTHMNSRGAARVPAAWSLKAYARQAATFESFIDRRRALDAPLLVGGDFNVRHAPDRFARVADAQPYQIVSRWCATADVACSLKAKPAAGSPWLDSQDQQGFAAGGPMTIQPVQARTVFDGDQAARLSDHDGYLVTYRLAWS